MKIVADKNVPFLEGVFEPYAEVVYMKGEDISRDDLMDADAMIIVVAIGLLILLRPKC